MTATPTQSGYALQQVTPIKPEGPLFSQFTDPALRFADEDGFLAGCDIHAEELERRVRSANSNVIVFRMPRRELELIADNYARAVCIARAYHLAEANRLALQTTLQTNEPAA